MLHDVMITCPDTQQPLATGVQLSEAVFETAVFMKVRVQCPHCEAEHRWDKADAFLQEAKREAYGSSPASRFVARTRARPEPGTVASHPGPMSNTPGETAR